MRSKNHVTLFSSSELSVCYSVSIALALPTANAMFELANVPFQNVNKREKMFAVCV